MEVLLKPMIRAEAHSDDHNVEVEFDAVRWFKQASDDEILELAECGWGGEYPADGVAEFFDGKKNGTSRLFRYLEDIAGDWSKKDCGGFECHVNEEDAIKWLRKNRPAVLPHIFIEPDVELLVVLPSPGRETEKFETQTAKIEKMVGQPADDVTECGKGVDVLFTLYDTEKAERLAARIEKLRFVKSVVVKTP
jgi:hypothetical protein